MNQVIKCKNLTHYYSGKAALNNVSFDLVSGEPIGLVGPNGAGKTTLFNILCGFLRPSSGNVTLFGFQPGASELCGKVSALPQDARLDPSFSISKQLSFFARLQGFSKSDANKEAIRVLEAVDLRDSLNKKPVVLSHGMGKRVAIAQALIGSPELVFLDEPTAGLDPVNTRNIRSIIAECSTDTTFVISSHDLTELGRLCRQVFLLDEGVMSSTTLDASNADHATQFITLQLEPCPATELIAELKKIENVLSIINPQKNEFIVEYNADIKTMVEVEILNSLAKNNWQYRQISRGKTLEQQLFFDK